eukprot:5288414-Amphidinium_carterae.1
MPVAVSLFPSLPPSFPRGTSKGLRACACMGDGILNGIPSFDPFTVPAKHCSQRDKWRSAMREWLRASFVQVVAVT